MKSPIAAFVLLASACAAAPSRPAPPAAASAPVIQKAIESIAPESFGPLITRRATHGVQSTFTRYDIKKGGLVPMHHHPNEQTTYVVSGKLVFTIEGVKHEIGPGSFIMIPPNVPHDARALEDTVEFDFFSPERRDWIEGKDQYLKSVAAAAIAPDAGR